MSRTRFFPYPVAEHALRLRYDLAADQLEVGETGRIRAEGVPESEFVRLALAVAVEEGTYDRVVPEAERRDPPVEVVVAVRSVSARQRRAIKLQLSDGGWHGEVEIPKKDLFGEVTLQPMLIRTAEGTHSGYAEHLGALIADGEAITIEIDEAPVPPGGFLDIKFDNFRDSGSPKRNSEPELLYMLDTEPDTPVLWLNEGVDELKTVMLAKGPRGYNLRIRDAMFDTVVGQVWTSLAGIAFTRLALALQEQRETEDDSDPLDVLPEWHQRVISFWAPHLYGGSRAEAIEEVTDAASDMLLMPELFDKLGVAVQKWAGTDRAFRGLIRMRDREGV